MGVSKDVVVVSDFGSNVCWFLRSRILAMVSSFFILLLFFHLLNLTITDTSPGTDHFELGPPFLLSSSCSSLDSPTTSEKENWATLDVLGPPAVKLLKNLSSSSSASAADTNQSTDDGRVVEDSFKDFNLNSCNFYEGRWVVDEDGPYYSPGSCPFIDASFDCARNGRPDSDYTKLRWQPNGCNIPRLDGKRMLEMMRGKRLAFVGDSLNRNMWESLVCILRESLEDKSRAFEVSGRHEFKTEGFYAFRFLDYNCSVEFVRSPFLVQEWEVLNSTAGGRRETLRLDVIERSSSQYREADFLIFNTGHWWTHPKTSQGKEYYQEGNHIYPELHVGEAYRKALQTWARWVDRNIDSNRTQIVFRGYSPSHFRGGQWNSGGSCDGEEQPITNDSYLSRYPKMMKIFESVMGRMRTPVSYLNITRMSDYRKDGHPSIFREPPAERQQQLGGRVQDCSHWCLPGIPDVWNQLLYAVLLRNQRH